LSEYVDVWQCIGCGKIEAPQPCIGVCKDRRARLVYAHTYERTVQRLSATESELARLARLLHQIVHMSPRAGQWEASYRAFQDKARELLAEECAPESK